MHLILLKYQYSVASKLLRRHVFNELKQFHTILFNFQQPVHFLPFREEKNPLTRLENRPAITGMVKMSIRSCITYFECDLCAVNAVIRVSAVGSLNELVEIFHFTSNTY